MTVKVSDKLLKLTKLLQNKLYIVGGYVRNSLLNLPTSDIDITAPHTPEQVFELLKGSEFVPHYTAKKLLTLKITCQDEGYEYTTFRKDSYTIGHVPSSVSSTDSLYEDALRRDFRINAIYYDIANHQIVDPLQGQKDLQNNILSTTRQGEEVFSQDGLRLMRLARLSSQLGFGIADTTMQAAQKFSHKIKEISPQRIRDELNKILIADTEYGQKYAHVKGIKLLQQIGVLDYILPELTLGIGMPQRKDFHKYDVFDHTLNTLKYADSSVRLAALLHDIGKPSCYKKTGRYHGHDKEGEKIAAAILLRLGYPTSTIEETKRLVLTHMFDLKLDAKESTVRLFVQKNHDIIDKICLLKQADYLGGGLRTGISPTVQRLQNTFAQMKEQQVPFNIKQLMVNGNDLIALDIPPKRRATALTELLKICATDNINNYNTKEKQLNYLKNFAK